MQGITIDDLINDRLSNAQRLFQVKHVIQVVPNCLFTGRRLRIPARGLNCDHQGAFELRELLKHIEQAKQWLCPNCNSNLPYKNIYVDQILYQALAEADSQTESIQISPSNTWELIKKKDDMDIAKEILLFANKAVTQQSKALKGERSNGMILTKKSDQKNSHYQQFQLASKKTTFFTRRSTMRKGKREDNQNVYWFPHKDPDIHKFDFESYSWKNIPQLSNFTSFIFEFSVVQSTGFYYVLGGVDYDLIPKDTVFEFSEENGVKEMPKMAYPRYRCATASLRGRVLVMGGYSTTGITQAVEILDIAQERWTLGSPMPQPRAGAVGCAATTQTVLIMGGTNDEEGYILNIDEYDAQSDCWNTLQTQMPMGIVSPNALRLQPGQKILIIGGYSEQGESDSIWVFDRARTTWRTDLPRLQKSVCDHWQFPVIYNKMTKMIHIFNGTQEPIEHLFYSVNFLIEEQADIDDDLEAYEARITEGQHIRL